MISDGFDTTPLPAISDIIITSRSGIENGQLHGAMIPTTSRGTKVQVVAAALEQVQRDRLGTRAWA